MLAFLLRSERGERISEVIVSDSVPLPGEVIRFKGQNVSANVVRREWSVSEKLDKLFLDSVIVRVDDGT